MDQKKIDRISELTRISRTRPLTEAEQAERNDLREEYRAAIRTSLTGDLDRTYIKYPDGTVRPVGRKQ